MRFYNQERMDNDIVCAIEARESEISNYQMNIVNFKAVLKSLDHLEDAWPEPIAKFKGKSSEEVVLKTSDEEFKLFNEYSHRDQIKILLKTTEAEMEKSKRVLDALEDSIDEDRVKAAMERLAQKQ